MSVDSMIDISQIRERARQRWLTEQRKKVAFLDRVEQSVPWWLILIAGTLFALSAPHTSHIFAQLTPVLGYLAPILVEFGLLYAAFIRKKRKQVGEKVPGAVWGLEVLLFTTAIIVNGAGSFVAVVSSVGISDLSTSAILDRFSTLPATAQVSLVLVPIAALIIPIGTMVAGEGLAALILERKQVKDDVDQRWAAAAPERLYEAFFDALIAEGVTPGKATQMAAAYVRKKPEDSGKAGIAENRGIDEVSVDKPKLAKGEAKTRLDALFHDDPASVHLPVEKLMELTGAGKSAVYDWRASKQNGHSHE